MEWDREGLTHACARRHPRAGWWGQRRTARRWPSSRNSIHRSIAPSCEASEVHSSWHKVAFRWGSAAGGAVRPAEHATNLVSPRRSRVIVTATHCAVAASSMCRCRSNDTYAARLHVHARHLRTLAPPWRRHELDVVLRLHSRQALRSRAPARPSCPERRRAAFMKKAAVKSTVIRLIVEIGPLEASFQRRTVHMG